MARRPFEAAGDVCANAQRGTTSERGATRECWPLYEQGRRFDLGMILNCAVTDILVPAEAGTLGWHHAGCWECSFPDNRLAWSGGVYDIFGLPRGAGVTRADAVALYAEDSRARMEQLRAHAIRHRSGFTLDAEILPACGGRRWIRLIGAPICEAGRVVGLRGLKLIV
jgi:PAS domain-containing protein